jgi:hypothetical protein
VFAIVRGGGLKRVLYFCRLSTCSTPAMPGTHAKEDAKPASLAPPMLCEGIELEALKVSLLPSLPSLQYLPSQPGAHRQ